MPSYKLQQKGGLLLFVRPLAQAQLSVSNVYSGPTAMLIFL